MAKASDNVYPKLIVSEGTAPASPAAGQQKLFVDSADHKLKRKDSAGTVTTVEGASYTDEQARDAIGAALVAGSGISIVVDDPGDTITVANTGATTKSVNAQTGTSYTLVLGDAGKFITMTNAAASTLTVPPNSSVAFPVGTLIEGAQLGAGLVTLTQGAGVTINATPGLKLAAQYGTFGILKTATDVWLAFGRLSA